MATIPAYNLSNVERVRDRLLDRVLVNYYHNTLQGELFGRFCYALKSILPTGVTSDAVFESVRYLAGRELTPKAAMILAWRLAGNTKRLRAGQAVPPWSHQPADEWVPLLVTRSRTARTRRGAIGTEFAFRVLAGSPCPMTIHASDTWKRSVVKMLAGKAGYSAPWGKFPFHRSSELVGLRIFGLVKAALSGTAPTIFEVDCPSTMVDWNRKHVLYRRFRVNADNLCPRGWKHPCHKCVVGYKECPAAVHRDTYEKGACNKCGSGQAIFDPESDSLYCIECTVKESLRKQT